MFSETRLKDLALDMCRSARNNKIQLLAPIAVMYGMMQPFSKTDFNEVTVHVFQFSLNHKITRNRYTVFHIHRPSFYVITV